MENYNELVAGCLELNAKIYKSIDTEKKAHYCLCGPFPHLGTSARNGICILSYAAEEFNRLQTESNKMRNEVERKINELKASSNQILYWKLNPEGNEEDCKNFTYF